MHINKFLYFGDFLAIPAALVFFAYLASATHGLAATLTYVLGLVLGVGVWTFAEYWVHRTLYHHAPVLSGLHARHHEAPAALIGVPSFLSSGLVILLTYGPFFALAPVFAAGFVSGALIGYAGYMFVHHATHHWTLQPGHWLYRARVRHMAHHYHDDIQFGIVTGFWDRVYGTTAARSGGTGTSARRTTFAVGGKWR